MRIPFRLLWSRLLASCFQSRCVGCKAWGRSPVCPSCTQTLPAFPPSACPLCMGSHAPCPLCSPDTPLSQVYASDPYQGPIRQAIHALKFDARPELADWLGRRMRRALPTLDPDWLLVPVPLSRERLAERRYNQAELLARAVALPMAPDVLKRTRCTPSQVGQGQTERWESMQDAFLAAPAAQGKRFLLIDDVLTTGATLTSAASALRAAGATDVRALVAARAMLTHPGSSRRVGPSTRRGGA